MTYPFCPSIVLLGIGSIVFYLAKRRKDIFVLFLFLLILIYCYDKLTSPKYIICLTLFYGIPASIALNRIKPLFKAVLILGIGIWWVFSISPYGITGPSEGRFVFVPTADGRVPTGSYLAFYPKVHDGWYQERYSAEYEGSKEIVEYTHEFDDKMCLYGLFNGHFYYLALVEQGYYDSFDKVCPWEPYTLPGDATMRIFMMSPSYLNSSSIHQSQWPKISEWLRKGQVRPICDEDSPFPLIIEIGDMIAPGTNSNMGKRILFISDYYKGRRVIQTDYYFKTFRPTCWVPEQIAEKLKEQPIYTDSENTDALCIL
jgi:hypothetical protein